MRLPDGLLNLLEQGVLSDVVRPLLSGKEADVFLVIREGGPAVAKVYKEANDRSFRQRVAYTEGRRLRDSRRQRAIDRGSSFGKEAVESQWRSAEVDAIYKLREAGVRVPEPYEFIDGVLVMELVMDDRGEPAPRLCDVTLTEDEAVEVFGILIHQVVLMTLAGVVHGDLSDFNVLMAWDGPVIIDFPQAVDPAANRNGAKLLIRDVDNLARFLGRFAPELLGGRFGDELWSHYERNTLKPETRLTGRYKERRGPADTSALLREIEAVEREAMAKRRALGLPEPRPARAPVAPRSMHGPKGGAPGGRPGPAPGGRPSQAPSGGRPVQAPQGGRPGAPRGGPRERSPRAPAQERGPVRAAEPQSGTEDFGDLDAWLDVGD